MNSTNRRSYLPCEPASARRRGSTGLSDVKYITGEEQEENTIKMQLKNEELKIATWNVRSLIKAGKIENTIQEMKRLNLDILGLSEVKWSDNGRIDKDDTIMYHSGKPAAEKEHHHGVGIMIRKELARYVTNFVPYSDRCMLLQFGARPFNLNVLQVYAPTAEKSDDEIESFYRQVEEVMESIKSQEVVIILGDMNAKIGREAVGKTVGNFGLGERNERGDRLLQFCVERDLVLTNTWYKQPPRRLYTWISPMDKPGRIVRNQIDYIMIQTRFRNSISSVKTYPGADIGSDHNPLVAKLKLKLKVMKKTKKMGKIDIDKLKNLDTKLKTKQLLHEELQRTKDTVNSIDIEETWNKIKTGIINTSKSCLGHKKQTKKLEWITEEILDLMEERRKHKEIDKTKYKEVDVMIRSKIREVRDKWYKSKCEEIETLEKNHDSFNLHKKVKEFTNNSRKKLTGNLVNAENVLVIDQEKQCKTWEKYIKDLFEDEREMVNPHSDVNDHEHQLEGPSILKEEVEKAINCMKNGKAVGPDGVHAEMLKLLLDTDSLQLLVKLYNEIYDTGQIPNDWLQSSFLPIPKKANAKKCGDHRLISVMSHALKVFLKILHLRIYNKIDKNISNTQFGFRNGLGTREALVAIQVLIQNCLEFNKDVYTCFIDFEKAFDNVKHEKLMKILKKTEVDSKDIRLIHNLYWNQTAHIKIGDHITGNLQILKGVRQGCILSPLLFNLYSESIFQEAFDGIETGIKVNGTVINNLRYADDTVLLAHSLEDLQYLLDRLNTKVLEYGLKMNISKTKYMIISKNETVPDTLKIDHKTIERVQKYRYLGTWLNEDSDPEKEIRTRIEIARSTYMKMKKLFNNKDIKLKLRWRMVKCYVLSVLLYGAEGWTLNKNTESKINAFEMWLYRRMLKISWRDRITNVEVLNRMKKQLEILPTIKKRKTAYFGHIYRHEKYNILRNIIEGKIEGKRGRGRRRITWSDNLRKWTDIKDTVSLCRLAQNRSEFRVVVADIR